VDRVQGEEEGHVKICLYCQGDLETRHVTLDKRWRGELFIIENVPALVCRQCGEKYLDGTVVEEIDQMVTDGLVSRQVTVPVLTFKVA